MEERRNSLLERKSKQATKMENTNRSDHFKSKLKKEELTPLQKYKKEEQEKERKQLEAREKAEKERIERERKEEEEKERNRLQVWVVNQWLRYFNSRTKLERI